MTSRWTRLLFGAAAVAVVCCDSSHTVEELGCADDSDCSEWGAFAPYCHRGMCSQCDTTADCYDGRFKGCATCEANYQGFGTCMPEWCGEPPAGR